MGLKYKYSQVYSLSMADEQTAYTIQRQEQGQTVYLEQLPGGGYHETTTPGGGGGYSGGVLFIPEEKNDEPKGNIITETPEGKLPATAREGDILFKVPAVIEALKPTQEKAKEKYLAGEPLTTNEIQLLGYEVQQRLAIEHAGGKYAYSWYEGGKLNTTATGPASLEGRTTINQKEGFGVFEVKMGLVKGENLRFILDKGGPNEAVFTQTPEGNIGILPGTTLKEAVAIANYAAALGQEQFNKEQEDEALRQSEFTWSRIPDWAQGTVAGAQEISEHGFGIADNVKQGLKSGIGYVGGEELLNKTREFKETGEFPLMPGQGLLSPVSFVLHKAPNEIKIGLVKAGWGAPDVAEDWFIKLPERALVAGTVALANPREATRIAQATAPAAALAVMETNWPLSPKFSLERAIETGATLGILYGAAKGAEKLPLKAGIVKIQSQPKGATAPETTGALNIYAKTGEGKFIQLGGVGISKAPGAEGFRVYIGEPTAKTFPELGYRVLPEQRAGNIASYPQTGAETAFFTGKKTLLSQGISEAKIAKLQTRKALVTEVATRKNAFVDAELPKITSRLNEKEVNIIKNELLSAYKSKEVGRVTTHGSWPEQAQLMPEARRLPGDIDADFLTKDFAVKRTSNIVRDMKKAGSNVKIDLSEEHVIINKGGEKVFEAKYIGEPSEVEGGIGIRYGISEDQPAVMIGRQLVQSVYEQFAARRTATSTTWFRNRKTGEIEIEPPSQRTKEPSDVYAEGKSMIATRRVLGMNSEAELGRLDKIVEDWGNLEWKTPGVKELIAQRKLAMAGGKVEIDITEGFLGIKSKTAGKTKLPIPMARSAPTSEISVITSPRSVSPSLKISVSPSVISPSISPRSYPSESISPSKRPSISPPSPSPSRLTPPSISPYLSPSPYPSVSPSVIHSPSPSPYKFPSLIPSTYPYKTPSTAPYPSIIPPPKSPPRYPIISTSPSKNFGNELKKSRKFKLPRFRTRAGLQPFLTLPEKAGLELRTGRTVGMIRSTPKTREIYRGAILKGAFTSGLLGGKRKRRR